MIILIALFLTLAILSKFYPIFILFTILLICFLLFIKLKDKIKIPLIIYVLFLLLPFGQVKTYEQKEISGTFLVYESKANYSLVKNSEYKFAIFEHFNYLDVIEVEGKVYDIHTFSLDNRVSSFTDYLMTKGVSQNIYIKSMHYKFKSPIRNFIKHDKDAGTILDYVLFNNNNIDDDLFNVLKTCLLLPMFVVSGMHINVLYEFLNKYLKKKYTFTILIIYLTYLNFQLPALRAFLMLLFSFFNDKYQLNIKKFDMFIGIYTILLMLHPMNLFNMSFILTFLCSFFLFFIKGNKFTTSIILNLGILPLIIAMNKEFNLMGIVISFLFSFLFKYFYYFSFIAYFIPLLDSLYALIFKMFSEVITTFNIFSVNLIIGNMSFLVLTVYYLVYLIILIRNNIKLKISKEVLIICSLLLVISYRVPLFNYQFVSIIDVGQGSCALIVDRDTTTLIDTGGSLFEDLAKTRVIPYLKSYGIKELDNVIISHNDFDHNGSLESLKKNFKVKRIYQSYLYKDFYLGNLYIKNLNFNKDYDGEDNIDSGVFYFHFLNRDFLIMSDAPISVELDIIAKYQNLKCDILVVGHHGSNTSSDYRFLEVVKPKLAVISCGYNNKYGHPHKQVIDNLNKLHIPYKRTDLDGTIHISNDNYLKKVIS